MNEKKINLLKRIFGTQEIFFQDDSLVVDGVSFPIVDGILILLPKEKYTPYIKKRLNIEEYGPHVNPNNFASDIQYTFGQEWKKFGKIIHGQHQDEFTKYFDLVNLNDLKDKDICDLGCGSGRWAFFLKNKCKSLTLVDFSDAIFEAKKNVGEADHILYIMADITCLPFKDNSFDFLYSIGVLHHLPVDCLVEIRKLKGLSPSKLIYLYYSLDNRPFYFKWALFPIGWLRKIFSSIKNNNVRSFLTSFLSIFIYLPCIYLGIFFEFFKMGKYIPLYEFYNGKSFQRIKQDVYDRFFTRIEQRVSRKHILGLQDTFSEVIISEQAPYWHFVINN